jgi:hypothetical protein
MRFFTTPANRQPSFRFLRSVWVTPLLLASAAHADTLASARTPSGTAAPRGVAVATAGAQAPAPAPAPSQPTLEKKVEILTEEVNRLREKLVIPEKEALKSAYGMGPAASKVYSLTRGLSLGGYGEFFVDRIVKNKRPGRDYNTGDLTRYVQYVGYKFTDRLLFNAEIELEHSITQPNFDGKSGAIEAEFAYLDWLAHPAVNLRAGLLLVPMGFINEIHEPPFFHGVLRPAVERVIIPATWRELGVGIFGEPVPGLTYKLYALGSLNAQKFAKGGWRSGRQDGNQILTENLGVVARADYSLGDLFTIGGSFFYGRADQNRIANVEAATYLAEGHAQVRFRGLELRMLGAYGVLSGARELTLALFPTGADLIASDVYGLYAEIAYDLWPLFSRKNLYLAPYFRVERLSTQHRVPTIAGRVADSSLDLRIFEAGITFKPHPQVVVKLSYRDSSNAADSAVPDSFLIGAGFVY